MSIIDNLITDRSQLDVDALRTLLARGKANWTAEELAEFNLARSKGSYNYTDLNRVTQAMDYLNERLFGYGYATGYQKVEVPHQKKPVSPLPDGYTQLAWIESSGTQYINTGYKPSSQTQLVMTISDFAGGAWKNLYGVRTTASSTDSKQFALGTTSPATTLRCDYFGSNATMTVTEYTGKTIIDHDKETLTAYGQSISNPVSSEAAGNLELILFGFNSAGSIANLATFKLYSCQIYDNGTLVRDFVPCTNPSEIAGLYDLVGGEFYGNDGSGEFFPGPETNLSLPEGYTQLEYIESSGEQYIDTGFQPNQNTRVVMDAYLSKKSSGATYFIGLAQYEPSAYYQVRIVSTAQHITSDFGADTKNFPELPAGRYVIDKNKNICTIGASVVTNSDSNFQSVSNLLLLSSTTTAGVISPSPGKIYSCKIYDNDTLTRDFVPCKDPSGEVGLYDLVGEQFYGNAGTGTFTDGPEVEVPDEPTEELDPYTWYEPDIPTPELMTAYLSNVQAIRSTLEVLSTTPETPESMEALTWVEANNIEQILVDVETVINRVVNAMARSNSFTFWSGNLPIPTAESNLGRTWAELDAMNTGWENWQVATWYLLLYGNLEAEGVVT